MPNTEADNLVINPVTIDEAHVHVVAAIIWKQDESRQFLIAQRQKGKHLQDYWEFPGGKLEPAESPWQALRRELEEEVCIRPISASPYMQVYYRYPDRNILLDTWVVDEYQGVVAPGEAQALLWIEASQAHLYRFPAADIPVIEAIKSSEITETRCLP
ncbi:MAG: (deoxy)nucleoside triphosphate pyrophosphohydrolase [Gammaproteobacteria bacterium]|nr:(deoxy)nucleoside triphosphate pyrophosphohydrolase [Gammaproteobacteria bacterium]